MLADSAVTDGGMVSQVGAKSGRRCTLTRASSEMGVHRRRDVDVAAACRDLTVDDADRDRHMPLQVASVPEILLDVLRLLLLLLVDCDSAGFFSFIHLFESGNWAHIREMNKQSSVHKQSNATQFDIQMFNTA